MKAPVGFFSRLKATLICAVDEIFFCPETFKSVFPREYPKTGFGENTESASSSCSSRVNSSVLALNSGSPIRGV